MAVVVLLGASGYTGRLVAAALDRRGVGFLAAGRDPRRVGAAVEGVGAVEGVRRVDVSDARALADVCDEADVLVTTVGPFDELGRGVLAAAAEHRCDYVDSSGEQPFLLWALDEMGPHCARAGVTAVPACGLDYLTGDLLAAVAAAEVGAAREVHVAYLVRGRGVVASRGTRRTLARLLGAPTVSFDGGERVTEALGEHRRPAFFPRPVGPRQAASFPGGEPLFVPRHVEGISTVRSYVAVPGVLVDAAQVVWGASRWQAVRTVLARVLAAGPEGAGEERRRQARWGCVAEAVGSGGTARAWAYGRDVYGFTAEALAAVTARLAAGGSRPAGVVAPAEAFHAEEVLDDLADLGTLRWSVRAADEAAG